MMRWSSVLFLLAITGCTVATVLPSIIKEDPVVPNVVVMADDNNINKYLGMSNVTYGEKVCSISVCMPSPNTPVVIFKRVYTELNFTIVVTAVNCSEANLESL